MVIAGCPKLDPSTKVRMSYPTGEVVSLALLRDAAQVFDLSDKETFAQSLARTKKVR